MNATAHLVHGFNVLDGGAGTTDKLRPHFEGRGFSVVEHDSKWKRGILRNLLSVRFENTKRAQDLAQSIQPDDLLVGHSNGCAIINEACWILAQINPEFRVRCVFINPALDVDSPISPIISQFIVFHTETDRTVWLSKLLMAHSWGAMGQAGYKGQVGSKCTNVAYETLGLMDMGHSGVFKTQKSLHRLMQTFDDWLDEVVEA